MRQESRNPAERTHSRGAVSASALPRVGYPAPVAGRRTLRAVARAAQHGRVRDVERGATGGERDDVVDGQVRGAVGGATVPGAPVAVLTTPGAEHAGAETLPGPRAVQRVVPAAIGLAGMLIAAATRAAGDDTTDRAQLHPQIVGRASCEVYSLGVLRPGGHAAGQSCGSRGATYGSGVAPSGGASRTIISAPIDPSASQNTLRNTCWSVPEKVTTAEVMRCVPSGQLQHAARPIPAPAPGRWSEAPSPLARRDRRFGGADTGDRSPGCGT